MFTDEAGTEGGTIEIEEKKFHYRQLAAAATELVIYEHDNIRPLLTCSFVKGSQLQNIFSPANKQTIHQYASLLLGLCWYLFNESFSKSNPDFNPVLSFA